jgi:putative NADH-flavin reductase
MNLTIVAATGGIGGLLLEEALEVGHTVTVVVRNPKALFKTLRTVRDRCREPNPDSMTRQSAIQGADTVLSGLVRGQRPMLASLSAVRARLFRR